jgi:hypothetical protein
MPVTVPRAPSSPAGRPQRAHAVWHAAVNIADGAPGDSPDDMVTLLRTAAFDPSTLQHALSLGHARVRREPRDRRLVGGWQLLRRASEWLGSRRDDGEVGAARARTGVTPAPRRSPAPPAGEPRS